MSKLKAVLFDLDGTLLDNNDVHLKAWKQYLKENGKEISDEDYKKNISGRTNKDAVEHIYDKKMSEEEAAGYYLKKEEIYRKMFAPQIAPISGLPEFLQELADNNIAMAIATSGIQVNIDFMFEHVPIKQYFKKVINSTHVTKGKPDPAIFLKTAEELGVAPESCIVFEDSPSGVKAAKSAKMKVAALTTSHTKDELKEADIVIKDYTEINLEKLLSVI